MKSIEFIGVPGSGKTTLARNFVEAENDYILSDDAFYISTVNNTDIPLTCILDILPKSVRLNITRVYSHTWKDSPISYTTFLYKNREFSKLVFNKLYELDDSGYNVNNQTKWLYNLASKYYICSKLDKNVVFDEGFCSFANSLFVGVGRKPKDSEIKSYLSTIPTPDVVLNIQCDLDICFERINNRKSGLPNRMKDLTKREVMDFMKLHQECFKYVENHLVDNGIDVYNIDNTGNVEESIHEIRQKVG